MDTKFSDAKIHKRVTHLLTIIIETDHDFLELYRAPLKFQTANHTQSKVEKNTKHCMKCDLLTFLIDLYSQSLHDVQVQLFYNVMHVINHMPDNIFSVIFLA